MVKKPTSTIAIRLQTLHLQIVSQKSHPHEILLKWMDYVYLHNHKLYDKDLQ